MTRAIEDRDWPRASSLLRSTREQWQSALLVGVPLYRTSLSRGRCDLAPGAVRASLDRFSTFDLDRSIDLRGFAIIDAGDLHVAEMTPEEAFEPVVSALRAYRPNAGAVLVLGGDNSVTRPMLHGIADSLADTGLITLDAHLDVRSTASGLTNGNPIRALIEDGMPGKNIVQIGLQPFANSAQYASYAREHGLSSVSVREVRSRGIETVIREALDALAHTSRIAIDFDLDVVDRAWMPGTPGSRPGGLTPHDVCDAAYLLGAHSEVIAADFVELDPTKDVADISVMTAAKCLLSFIAGMTKRNSV